MKRLKRLLFVLTALAIMLYSGCDNADNFGGFNSDVTVDKVEILIDIPGTGVAKAMEDSASIEIKVYPYNTTTLVTGTPVTTSGSLTKTEISTGVYRWTGTISFDDGVIGTLLFCARALNGTGTMLYCGQQTIVIPTGGSSLTIAMKDHYDLRDVGPAGGLIFYDDMASGAVDVVGYRYLEAAPAGQRAAWSSVINTLVGPIGTVTGTRTGIGTGKQNTLNIIAQSATSAANLCSGTLFGYSDWFLPSQDELKAIWDNIVKNGSGYYSAVGGYEQFYYWSSSELSASLVWYKYFSEGGQNQTYKKDVICVRAVRAFQ